MTVATWEPMPVLTRKAVEPAELNEVMRVELTPGQEAHLLELAGPLVLDRNVTLDLAGVQRIDAAGISVLVELYRSARESGHRFGLTNVSARVAQILSVVGLDRFLLSANVVQKLPYGPRFRRPAA